MGKPFSRTLFDQYDRAGRNAIFDYLVDLGWDVRDNPDPYGIDLLCEANGREIGVEVEVKVYWQDRFPFRTLHIPHRKQKFAHDNTIFAIVSGDLTRAALVLGSDVRDAGLVQKLTSQTGDKQDLFFEVTLDRVEFVILKETPRP